jgi:hypothetical protein
MEQAPVMKLRRPLRQASANQRALLLEARQTQGQGPTDEDVIPKRLLRPFDVQEESANISGGP